MEKSKKIFKYVLVILYIIIVNISYFTKLINDNNPSIKWQIVYWVLSTFITLLILILIKIINKKHEIKPENAFVICAIFLELTYMFATPMFKGHDEQYQWYRDYEISTGKIRTINNNNIRGNYLPSEVGDIYAYTGNFEGITYSKSIAAWKYSIENRNNDSQLVFIDTSPTASYSPLQVLPQATGVFIARHLGFDIYSQAMIGRLFNVIFFVIMGYLIIKIAPVDKYLFGAILLCPKVLYISSTLSSDNIINMCIMLFIANVLKLRYYKTQINWKDYLIFGLTLPVIGMAKFVYIPICGLLLLIPKQCFKNSNKKKILFIVIAALIALCAFLGWKKIGNITFTNQNVQVTAQSNYCIQHPISSLGILIRGVSDNIGNWLLDTVGGYMQWGRALSQPQIISILVYVVLLVSLINEEKDYEFSIFEKIWITLIILAITAGIIIAMYIGCVNVVGATYVEGVQGKYFVPILGLLMLLIPTKNIKFKKKINDNYIYIMMLLFQIPSLLNIFVANIK